MTDETLEMGEEAQATEEIVVVQESTEDVSVEELINALPEEDREFAKNWRPDGKKSLEQFVHDGKFIAQIEHQKKLNQETQNALKEMKRLLAVQRDLGYKKALEDFEAQKEEAILFGDVSKVREIDAKIKEVDSFTPDQQILLDEFAAKHEWVTVPVTREEEEMRERAIAIENRLALKGMPLAERLVEVEKAIRRAYPSYYGDTQQNVPPPPNPVAAASNPDVKPKGKQYSIKDLSPIQRDMCKTLEKQGLMSAEDYIKSLIATGEL